MTKGLDDWILDFADALPEESSASLTDALITVCQRLNDIEPKVFSLAVLNKYLLRDLAKPLSLKATTADELEATAHVLNCLYQVHIEQNKEIVKPNVSLPLREEWALFDNKTPPLGVIEALQSLLYFTHPSVNGFHCQGVNLDSANLGQAMLTVVFRCGLTELKEVEALTLLSMGDWHVVTGKYPIASVIIPSLARRVYLTEESILAMYRVIRVISGLSTAKKKQLLYEALEHWKSYAQSMSRPHIACLIEQMSVACLVRYLSFMQRSAGMSHLWPLHNSAEAHTFIRAFTGRITPHSTPKRASNEPLNQDGLDWEQGTASSVSFSDRAPIKQILDNYALHSPKQQRNDAHFANAKRQLQALIDTKTHWASALLTQWITSLFLVGSPWKNKLAVSSLLNYHSTVQRFIKAAWRDKDCLALSVSDFELCCQHGINNNQNADEQRTILRFLSFCLQYERFPRIDTDALELINRKHITRAHYIPPALFDDICLQFCPSHGSHPIPVIVVMQLCYYAGLREDEALSLYIQDIDFNTGMLYVTHRKKRKSAHAVRKVPLALIPRHILSSISLYIEEQNLAQQDVEYHERTLIDPAYYIVMEAEFIDLARSVLKDDSIVTHSFRHCAANNWCYLLATQAFQPRSEPALYFNQHPLFSKEQRELIHQAFVACGIQLTPYFPVLDWVSDKLGHGSVKVTLSSYLHILDWITLVITSRPKAITKAALRYWCADSNYGFERQKQLLFEDLQTKQTGVVNPISLNDWVKKYWREANCISVKALPTSTREGRGGALLAFSQFARELEKQKLGLADDKCHPAISQWLVSNNHTPTPFMANSRQASSWLKLSLTVDKWSTLPASQLRTMKKRMSKFLQLYSERKELTRYRDLHNVLTVYQLFNLHAVKIKTLMPEEAIASHPWLTLMKRFDVVCIPVPHNGKLKAVIRPHGHHWPLWQDLDVIVRLFIHYLEYSLVIKSEEGLCKVV
ncbi:tyrosine-type recombinase/integrase [Motilimonas sp. KMU-193]|uniref:tyrosine-type recombinase/integrase n=1 Tax=Motilimonas sp. KMU-193 TaxID=3388668 RepID=UPI00396AFF98